LINHENIAKCINKIAEVFPDASLSLATSGVQIKNLLLLASQINCYPKIQLSFHSPFDEERQELIPNTANLKEILDALSLYQSSYKTKITLNYIVLDDINDTLAHVQ
jgi:adenine C2-methylase RlmN of 23S rRNA A2503 and tRNA A37